MSAPAAGDHQLDALLAQQRDCRAQRLEVLPRTPVADREHVRLRQPEPRAYGFDVDGTAEAGIDAAGDDADPLARNTEELDQLRARELRDGDHDLRAPRDPRHDR